MEQLRVPFCASASWYAGKMRGIAPEVTPRDVARTVIASPAGALTLSVPVEGGGHALRSRNVDLSRIMLSEHGKWRSEHLSAWRTAYGRTPYFVHLYPEIEAVYRESEERKMSLAEFCGEMDKVVWRWISPGKDLLERTLTGQQRMLTESQRRYFEEIARRINGELSIFDALFRLGPDVGPALYIY